MGKKKKSKWYKLNRSLHRDIGYFCIGMTLIFAISGIAVNHIHDWNPNYSVEQITYELEGIASTPEDALQDQLLQRTGIELKARTNFWPSEREFKVFFDGGSNLILDLDKEIATLELIAERPILRRFNALHLNHPQEAWTYFSDFYAGLLIFLSLSALFMVKGRKGIIGRGGIYFALGLASPVVFIILYSV